MCLIMTDLTQGAIYMYAPPLPKKALDAAGALSEHPVMVVSQNRMEDDLVDVMSISTDDHYLGYELALNNVRMAPMMQGTIVCEHVYPVRRQYLKDLLGYAPHHLVKACITAYAWHIGLTETMPRYIANNPDYLRQFEDLPLREHGTPRAVKGDYRMLNFTTRLNDVKEPDQKYVEKSKAKKNGFGRSPIVDLMTKSAAIRSPAAQFRQKALMHGTKDCKLVLTGEPELLMKCEWQEKLLAGLGVDAVKNRHQMNGYVYKTKGHFLIFSSYQQNGTLFNISIGAKRDHRAGITIAREKTPNSRNVSAAMAQRCMQNCLISANLDMSTLTVTEADIAAMESLDWEDKFRVVFGKINAFQLGKKFKTKEDCNPENVVALVRADAFWGVNVHKAGMLIEAIRDLSVGNIPSEEALYYARLSDIETICAYEHINWSTVKETLVEKCGFDFYRDLYVGMLYVQDEAK